MRLVQVMIPAGKRDAVLDLLDEEGVDYALTDEVSDREFTAIVEFPLPAAAVEPVLESLREAGVERDAYTVVVAAETVVSRRFEALKDRYEETDAGESRIAREELVARADDLAPRLLPFVVLTAVSSVVAVAGLLLDSAAVVVGSMVIAPLVGPAMATGVGTVLDERELFARGVKLQLLGGMLTVASATVFAGVVHETGIVPMGSPEVFALGEVRERLTPDVLSLVVALTAGAAGALSLSTGVSTALVGVMIAAALVPPAAVVGIGIAWGEPTAVLGSAVLVLVNFLSVNLATLAVLRVYGYRPSDLLSALTVDRLFRRRAVVLVVAILVLSSFLLAASAATGRTATFEERTQAATAELVADTPAVTLRSVEVAYVGGLTPSEPAELLLRRPQRVTVTVGHQPGVDPPLIADRLHGRLAAVASGTLGVERAPAVEIRYVAVDHGSVAAPV